MNALPARHLQAADVTPTPGAPEADVQTAPPARRRSRLRLRATLVGLVSLLLLGAFAGQASAAVSAGGQTFYTQGVRCDAKSGWVTAYAFTTRPGVAYAQVWLHGTTGGWFTGPWVPFVGPSLSGGSLNSSLSISGHGYLTVVMKYAQWTANGYVYVWDTQVPYTQGTVYGTSVDSTSCYV